MFSPFFPCRRSSTRGNPSRSNTSFCPVFLSNTCLKTCCVWNERKKKKHEPHRATRELSWSVFQSSNPIGRYIYMCTCAVALTTPVKLPPSFVLLVQYQSFKALIWLVRFSWHLLTAFLCPDLNAREHSGGRICSTVSLITSAHDSCSSFLSGRTRQYTWGRRGSSVCV